MAKKPDITTIASGYASNTSLNANFESLRDGFDNVLSLDGSTPNAMQADLDMNGNDIINASSITIDGVDVFTLINKITVSTSDPSGGQDGDIWFKVSS